MGLTQSEAARRLGITQGAVSQRVKRGTLKTLRDGTLSPADVERLRSELNPARSAAAKRGFATPTTDADDMRGAKSPAKGPPAKPAPDDLSPHQRKALADAAVAEAKLAKLRGLYVEVASVTATVRQFSRRVHDAVLALPDDVHRALDGHQRCGSCGAQVDVRPLTLELERHLREVLDVLAAAPVGPEQ